MLICAYEDRVSDLVGLKLLILSLARHCPDLSVNLFCPTATPDFCRWLKIHPQVRLREIPAMNTQGWNVKPDILLTLLNEGHNQVIWLDSDIIITKDFKPLLDVTDDTLVVAQEHRWDTQGSEPRTNGWGLPHGRKLASTVNTCFIRVTPAHRRLLEEWKRYLATPAYREAQAKEWSQQPVHLVGDQDVFTALLGSSAFADVKLHYLRRGLDIAQCFQADGFTVSERLANLFCGLPVFVHAQGPKPWRSKREQGTYLELSPYCFAARPYRKQLNEDTSWIDIESRLGKILHILALGHPSLQGLPLALNAQLKRIGVRSTLKYLRLSKF